MGRPGFAMGRAILLLAAIFPATASAAEPEGNLLAKHELLQFRVSGGKFVAPKFATAQSRLLTFGEDSSPHNESLQIDTEGDDAGFRYKKIKGDETMLVAYVPDRALTWERRTRTSEFRYEQTPQGCRFLVKTASRSFERSDRDLWRILAVATAEERTAIASELDLLLPASALLTEVREIERLAAEPETFDTDSELRSVVKKSAFTPDYPQAAAERLRRDPSFWFAMLDHGALETRKRAHKNLERLLSRSLTFDPAGDLAARTAARRKIGEAFFPQTAEENSRREKLR